MELVFVTNNIHKLSEISAILGNKYLIKSLKDIGFIGEIPETNPTIKENALEKAKFIYDRYKKNCFADDTGLKVDALNGKPGVLSARYAGKNASYKDNMYKLLKDMTQKENRKAKFLTVICLIINRKEYFFEGVVNGHITKKPFGIQGFGYDPVFRPNGYQKTYAQMSPELKNSISHRALATEKLVSFLEKNF